MVSPRNGKIWVRVATQPWSSLDDLTSLPELVQMTYWWQWFVISFFQALPLVDALNAHSFWLVVRNLNLPASCLQTILSLSSHVVIHEYMNANWGGGVIRCPQMVSVVATEKTSRFWWPAFLSRTTQFTLCVKRQIEEMKTQSLIWRWFHTQCGGCTNQEPFMPKVDVQLSKNKANTFFLLAW